MLRNTTFPLVAMTALASGYTVGRILAERNAAPARFAALCSAGVAGYILARRLDEWHTDASDLYTFPSPLASAADGEVVELLIEVMSEGIDWHCELALLTPITRPAGETSQPRIVRHVLATVEASLGEVEAEVEADLPHPIPAALLNAVSALFARIADVPK